VLENITVWVSGISLVVSAVLLLWRKECTAGWALYCMYVAGAAVSMAALVWHLSTHSMEVMYVWQRTTTDTPVYYCVLALFTGREGVLLVWNVMAGGTFLYMMRKSTRPGYYAAALLPLGLALLFTAPFSATPASDLTALPSGRGMNPELVTPFLSVHPAATFAGYSLAMAAAVRRYAGEDASWVLRGSLFFLFLSLALGALWAHTTRGWGGYWSWDPVESSSLITFLVATAALHTKGALGRLSASLLYPSVMFTALSARGGLWHTPHGFIEADVSVYALGITALISLSWGVWLYIKEREPVKLSHAQASGLFMLAAALVVALTMLRTLGSLWTPDSMAVRVLPFLVLASLTSVASRIRMWHVAAIIGAGALLYALTFSYYMLLMGLLLPAPILLLSDRTHRREKGLIHLGLILILTAYCGMMGMGSVETVQISQGDAVHVGAASIEYRGGVYVNGVPVNGTHTVLTFFTYDVDVSVLDENPSTVKLHVRYVPMSGLLYLGMFLSGAGMAFLALRDSQWCAQ